jgi:hypothetical protein
MVSVALVSLMLWANVTWERRKYCLRRADYWASREQEARRTAKENGEASVEYWRRWAIIELEAADKYGRLRLKYEHGAAHPWVHVIPEPDEYWGRIWPGVGFVAEGLEGD